MYVFGTHFHAMEEEPCLEIASSDLCNMRCNRASVNNDKVV